jgi:hypothetical protein
MTIKETINKSTNVKVAVGSLYNNPTLLLESQFTPGDKTLPTKLEIVPGSNEGLRTLPRVSKVFPEAWVIPVFLLDVGENQFLVLWFDHPPSKSFVLIPHD